MQGRAIFGSLSLQVRSCVRPLQLVNLDVPQDGWNDLGEIQTDDSG